MLFESTIIVCQGNFEFDYHKVVIEEYKNFNNVVFSTWPEHLEFLISLGVREDKILISEKPNYPGIANSNLQFKSSYVGIDKMKEKYKYAFKIRSDLLISNKDFPTLINLLRPDLTYFPAWHNHEGGYLCEHFIFGECEVLIKLLAIFESEDNQFPERKITNKYLELKFDIGYIFPILYKHKIQCFWTKRNFYLNDYENDSLFVYDYCPE